MRRLPTRASRAAVRAFALCQMPAQAAAFCMFLAFFPMLLFALGLLSSTSWGHRAVAEMAENLRIILPPESSSVVLGYLIQHGAGAVKWILLGFAGTVIAGAQVMVGLMEGFRLVAGDPQRPSFFRRQVRALFLLGLTIAPWLATTVLTIYGKQVRTWAIHQIGASIFLRVVWFLSYWGGVLALTLGVLMLVYRFGQPRRADWHDLLPGAAWATGLWWIADFLFAAYVKHVPYNVVYGRLAAAIGLLLWMYMSALIIFTGASYNAERMRERGRNA